MTDVDALRPTRDTLVFQTTESAGEWLETDTWVELPESESASAIEDRWSTVAEELGERR